MLWLRLGFMLGLWLRLSHGVINRRQGSGEVSGLGGRLGKVEVSGEDEVSEVDAELPAPDGEPLDVADLHVLGKPQGDLLLGGSLENGGALVPVLIVSRLNIGVGQNLGLGLIGNTGGGAL